MRKTPTIVALLWITQATAFEVKEHNKITQIAIQQTAQCLFNKQPLDELPSFVKREDYNLSRKWFGCCSHYYNPPEGMLSRRDGAELRVRYVEDELSKEFSLRSLGFYIHHLQDVASPLHVVPIEHGMNDKFENFHTDSLFDGVKTLTCAELQERPVVSLFSLYEETAQTTKSSLTQQLTATFDGKEKQLDWRFFFTPNKRHKLARDTFGEESFTHDKQECRVSLNQYEQYKRQQLELAIQATQRAIYRFLGENIQE